MIPEDTLKTHPRVWVVDDDETTLLLAQETLSQEGFQIETFTDSRAALEKAVSGLPDIIVLDVLMPGLNGFEFCSRIRALPSGQDVPVLMATSLDDPSSIHCAYEAGATNFTAKPLNWTIETHRLRYMLRAAEMAKELRRVEHETRLAKEDWERTFDSISDIVTLLSPDLRILRANATAASATQRTVASLIGARCHEVFQGSSTPCTDCPVLYTIEHQSRISTERAYRNPSAQCLVSAAPVIDREGRLLHIVHVARDLTEEKRLELAYRHAQKMEAIGTLAGGVAHDFNNILQIVLGYGGMLATDQSLSAVQKEDANAIVNAAQRASGLAQQLLTFSRKSLDREKQEVDLNQLIRGLEKMLERVLPKNVSIQTKLALNLPHLFASSDQLHQVLMNLAVNAAHAMPNGGTLAFATSKVHLEAGDCCAHPDARPGDYVLISVSDTGHGMDERTLSRIFEPFFTTKKVGEGTGLGLSVVYGIVRGHEGWITCQSRVGVGTTFRIWLPAKPLTVTGDVRKAPLATAVEGTGEMILVVDDESAIRQLLSTYLAKLGYRVILAVDGESAVFRYREAHDSIRLVLLDLGMPGMGGWECVDKLRAIDPAVRILITTGYGGEDTRGRAQNQGVAGFIDKPFAWNTLATKLREVLETAPKPETSA